MEICFLSFCGTKRSFLSWRFFRILKLSLQDKNFISIILWLFKTFSFKIIIDSHSVVRKINNIVRSPAPDSTNGDILQIYSTISESQYWHWYSQNLSISILTRVLHASLWLSHILPTWICTHPYPLAGTSLFSTSIILSFQ